MTTCLKYCVPISSAMLLGAMLWMYAFPGGLMAQFRKRRRRGSNQVARGA